MKKNIWCFLGFHKWSEWKFIKEHKTKIDSDMFIKDIINDRFNNKIYNLLNNNDRRIVKSFVKIFKYDLGIQDKNDDSMQEQFNILLGEYEAGNNNPEIIKKIEQNQVLLEQVSQEIKSKIEIK